MGEHRDGILAARSHSHSHTNKRSRDLTCDHARRARI
jgi:hypothetical protein